MLIGRRGSGNSSRGRKLVALCLILALIPACQWSPAQFYIPLAYAVTGMCVALLMSPTLHGRRGGAGGGLPFGRRGL